MASRLNIRSGPTVSNPKIANPPKKGTKVDILNETDSWYQEELKLKGWVVKSYVKRVE